MSSPVDPSEKPEIGVGSEDGLERRSALCATIQFDWSGVRWTVDYVVLFDSEVYRGQSAILAGVVGEGEDARVLQREEIEARLAEHPGQFERKAAHWARRVLFGAQAPRVRIAPRDYPKGDTPS